MRQFNNLLDAGASFPGTINDDIVTAGRTKGGVSNPTRLPIEDPLKDVYHELIIKATRRTNLTFPCPPGSAARVDEMAEIQACCPAADCAYEALRVVLHDTAGQSVSATMTSFPYVLIKFVNEVLRLASVADVP